MAKKLKGEIHAQTIWALYRSVLDPKGQRQIVWSDAIGKYVRGGEGVIHAFANVLNRSPQFKGYGLGLVPGDMTGVKTVEDVAVVIANWFKKNNWKVVL